MVPWEPSMDALLNVGPVPTFHPDEPNLIVNDALEWSPRLILRALGEAPDESEVLIRLIIACAVIEGPRRIEALIIQIDRLCAGHQTHLKMKLSDRMYKELGPGIKELLLKLASPRQTLQNTKARIANVQTVAGARFSQHDLDVIVYFGRLCVVGYLIATSRNVVAAKDMLRIFSKPPSLLDAEEWKKRLLSGSAKSRALLFQPKDYDRVVVVLNDGTLMYDPESSSVASN